MKGTWHCSKVGIKQTKEEDMSIVGLDHIVVNTRDVDRAIGFYQDILGMEILRLEQFREGKVGFVSARVSDEIIIDIRPDTSGEAVTPNMDHFCLVLGPTDMNQLHADLIAKGVSAEEDVRPAWGAQGYGEQFKIWDPEGNKIELRCYAPV
jgi:catechol 2,3-dioxygenase-like lactoylglutathione lyase family enzyme